MKYYFFALSLFILIPLLSFDSFAQTESPPNSSQTNLANPARNNTDQTQLNEVSRENREKSYKKLLEGQRFLWTMRRGSESSMNIGARLAKTALQEAVELNPKLAEAYTALAELAITAPPQDIDEALMLAAIATKLDKDNFGGHRILARLSTIKSNLGRGKLNTVQANQAINEWTEITRLDPGNAEAWAFLSEFYDSQNRVELQIDALRKWVSSTSPLETGFFNRVMNNKFQLTVEDATFKLGAALFESGKSQEALEVLSRSIADDPSNLRAIELFRRSLEGADNSSLLLAVESLRQVVFVHPENESLVQLLAQTLAKTGQIDDAATVLRGAVADNLSGNKDSASNLQVVLGDIYADSSRTNEAIAAYQNALSIRGIANTNLAVNDNKDFAIKVVSKMIQAYKKANRPNDAKILIEKYRALFGKDDLFADKELTTLYRNSGKNLDSLNAKKSSKNLEDFSY